MREMGWMLKNSDSKPDAMLTLSVIGFTVVMAKVLLAGATLVMGERTFNFGSIDAATVAAVITPTLGAYVARRHTEKRFTHSKKEQQ